MLIVYPFNPKDETQALKNAVWLSEITTPGKHKALVVYDSRCNPKPITATLSKSFQILDTLKVNDYYNKWPESANLMFEQAARLLEYKYPQEKYFLFLEPDAILVQKDGLDKLEAEFLRGKKPFMGACVPRFVDNKGGVSPEHLSGVSIYPNPIVSFAGAMLLSSGEPTPFDLIAAEVVNPQSHFTDMIQHRWSPPFNPNPPFTSLEDIRSRMTSECVLYHSDKSGSIIDVLRKERGDVKCQVLIRTTDLGSNAASKVQSSDAAPVSRHKKQPRSRGEKKKPLSSRHGDNKTVESGLRGSRQPAETPKPATLTLKERRQAQAARMRASKAAKKASSNGIVPWNNRIESLGEINRLCKQLKKFCCSPNHIHRVREELKSEGVIR